MGHLQDASADLRLAAGMAAFAEKLRGADDLAEVSWTDIDALVRSGLRPGSERDDEALELVALTRQLQQRPRPEHVSLALGEPTALGAVARPIVEEVFARHTAPLRYCHQRVLNEHPDAAGELVVEFTIGEEGSVSSASVEAASSELPEAMTQCVFGRLRKMRFPPAQGGGVTTVSYPMTFTL